ncbi:MAG: N-acetylmuramoyl-L-alanine amidase [Myxococcota bacterium]|nr:N-acetylmuramoyl-L-alanine amidase [Myxococcota bacterium]
MLNKPYWLGFVFVSCLNSAIAAPTLVVLDPGHGGENLGAPSLHHPHQHEKDFTLPIAKLVQARLEAEGIEVVLTRQDDRELTLLERVAIANHARGTLLVSIHLNSSKRIGPSGPMTFLLSAGAAPESKRRMAMLEEEDPSVFPPDDARRPPSDLVRDILLGLIQQRSHERSLELAQSVQKHLAQASPFPGRGIRQEPFYVLMGVSMPAVVAEIGFINHPSEGKYITSPRGMRQIANGIANGILAFDRRGHQSKKPPKEGK